MTKDEISKEDLEAINKDLEKATVALSEQTKDAVVKTAKEEGRKEAEKEMELKRQLEEQSKKTAELESKLAETQKVADEQLKMIQKKVDEMASSKAVIAPQDPFKKVAADVDSWSKGHIDKLEESSARAFFGPEYDRMLDQRQ